VEDASLGGYKELALAADSAGRGLHKTNRLLCLFEDRLVSIQKETIYDPLHDFDSPFRHHYKLPQFEHCACCHVRSDHIPLLPAHDRLSWLRWPAAQSWRVFAQQGSIGGVCPRPVQGNRRDRRRPTQIVLLRGTALLRHA